MTTASGTSRNGAARTLTVVLALVVLIGALAYATARRAPSWEDQAARTTVRPAEAASHPAADRIGGPVGPGLRPSPEKLLPIDNSRFTRMTRQPDPPSPPAEPSAETPAEAQAEAQDDTVPRSTRLPRPIALDSGSFQIGTGTVRLAGIQPLQPTETCGSGPAAWPCGAQARTALRALVLSRSITCTVPGNFTRAKETVESACSLGDVDLGEWLVENGWARARDDGRYGAVQAKARDARIGIWAETPTAAGAADITPSPADLPAPPQ